MDLEYDRKFEEMKKYIPFLESMIKRLENTSLDSNPRQAQLDKIKSLRDLLMDKKKRMKMENLLKCEQVLVNLYAKVEQRDSWPGPQKDVSKTDKSNLNIVRNKLKSVVSKLHQEKVETLPEIARASETEEICVPGSKEPALFQRRPNIPSVSPNRSKEPSLSKRSYTRVLHSPESSEKHWANEVSSEKPLFSRRSPRPSPRKRSPSYYRKERKKSSKNKSKCIQKTDLNITLNVPEDSLHSLNTKDILSRILNCSDNDVDIATLRELRTQILGELKDTGANDDISDLILKSYKKKSKKGNNSKEVEEGELSDSESEAIESIYGSLVVLDKNKSASTESRSSDKEMPRKIQICLVINSDKTESNIKEKKDNSSCIETSDFESFNKKDEKSNEESGLEDVSPPSVHSYNDHTNDSQVFLSKEDEKNIEDLEVKTINNENIAFGKNEQKTIEGLIKSPHRSENKYSKVVEVPNFNIPKPTEEYKTIENKSEGKLKPETKPDALAKKIIMDSSEPKDDVEANVDIPLLEPTNKQVSEIDILQALKNEILNETTNVLNTDATVSMLTTPPLHQPKITKVANAQEIGCKKRISIESYKAKTTNPSIYKPSTDNNVNNIIKDDVSRKQSLKLTEKECERFNFLSKLTLTESSDDEDNSSLSLDDIYTDLAPKSPDHEDFADTGLKPPIIIPSDPVQTAIAGSETDIDMRKLLQNVESNDISTDPLDLEKSKSLNTDNEISKIHDRPADPRKRRDSVCNKDGSNSQSVNFEKSQTILPNFITSIPVMHDMNMDMSSPSNVNLNTIRNIMITPSVQTLNMAPIMSPNLAPPNVTSNMSCSLLPNMTPTRIQNSAPIMTPSRTPNLVNMTPSRTPNIVPNMTPTMTPSHHTFDNDDYSNQKHVYAPMFSSCDSRDIIEKPRENHQANFETSDSRSSFWEDIDPRNSSVQRDTDYRESINYSGSKDMDYRDVDYRDTRNQSVQRDTDVRNNSMPSSHRNSDRVLFPPTSMHSISRLDCPPTPTASFGMLEMPMTPIHPFGRSDCPPTPNHPFGRLECPPTPSHPFGRLECPPTPSHPFGRLECPPTPSHPFGRSDCPPTPSHPFGRSDCPSTPSHPFGISDCPTTPNHPFGRPEPLLPVPHSFLRSEYSTQSVSRAQDPRLNRNSDYDGHQYRDDDRDRTYYQERKYNSGSYYSDKSNRHNNSEVFRRYHREQSVGRSERQKNYDDRNYRDQISRHETSIARTFNREDRGYSRSNNREYESDRYAKSSHRGRSYDYRNNSDSKNYDERGRRIYHREKSDGRTQEEFSKPIKSRNESSRLSEDKKIYVQPHDGRSFKIDTSVNSTFQEMITKPKSRSSFDDRRRRASSVGRTLLSDKSNNGNSTQERKTMVYDTETKNRNSKNFRRACSVGREVEDHKRDFKDIKADLKSFKITSDLRFSKDDVKKSNERIETSKLSGEKKIHTKYSPRKNNRDPRMSRETTSESKNYRSNSREPKNYGIVYSNDNISKGKILDSGAGVKNYKIPKIKRPQETTESIKTITVDYAVSEEENKSCLNKKNETNENGINIDIQNEIKEDKPDSNLPTNDKNDNTSKNQNPKDIKNVINDKKEFNSDDIVCETSVREKESNRENKNSKSKKLQVAKNKDLEELEDDCNKQQKKGMEIDLAESSPDISLETSGRRVTRSARKSMPVEPTLLDISPIKRTRRIKKSFVLESDSDDNDSLAKLKPCNSEVVKEISQKICSAPMENDLSSYHLSSEVPEDKEFDVSGKQKKQTDDTERSLLVDKPVTEPKGASKLKPIHNLSENINSEKFENDSTKNEISDTQILLEEKSKLSEDDLNSSFSIGDLEMFPDNITSDPVVDNINALIADLDHDLDSTKNTETSHFTKELSLETMLETLSSPDKNDKKEMIKDLNEQKISEINTSEEILGDVMSAGGGHNLENAENPTELTSNAVVGEKRDEALKSEMEQNNFKSQCSDSKKSEIEQDLFEKNKLSPLNTYAKDVEINKGDTEDTCSNDAIVSTTVDGITYKPEMTFKNLREKDTASSQSTPDSTINSNENIEDVGPKSVLPTNESSCDMHSDITSTHVTDGGSKDSLEVISPDVGTTSQIESIGKLLSILQDKTKIKELLTLLGNHTSENEKIKKKLEKLSEIVSDDESPTENTVTDHNLEDSSSASLVEDHSLNVIHKQEEINKPSCDTETHIAEAEVVNIQSNCDNQSNVLQEDSDANKYSQCEETPCSSINTINAKILNEAAIITENQESSGDTNNKIQDKISLEKNCQDSEEFKIQSLNKCEESNQKNITTVKKIAKKNVKRKNTRKGKKRGVNKSASIVDKRSTRSDSINLQQLVGLDKPAKKKCSRELQKLQEDIREMFIKDDILNATGLRMCRIAKLVDEKTTKDDVPFNENNGQEPLVVLEKFEDLNTPDKIAVPEKVSRKKNTKSKIKAPDKNSAVDSENESDINRTQEVPSKSDPYDFETEFVNEPDNESDNRNASSSESDSESVGSNKSFESIESSEIKKKVKRKRGRGGWQAGIIKPKNRKKKSDQKPSPIISTDEVIETKTRKIPDFTCFTDKSYCFRKNVSNYNCRICLYSGNDIVHHYKKEHPHTEVPLSRLCANIAKEAIKESEDINFQAISRISSKKYVCRFCFKEFARKKRLLETFFWHIVSMHTGEYKQTCSKCVDTQSCPLDIDIPPPPKDAQGQLLGYICEKCNYTQISLENLKTHVIVWHNDEQTAVYTVNLAFLSKTATSSLLKLSESSGLELEQSRVLRSSRSNQSMAEGSDSESESSEEFNEKSNNIVQNKQNEDESTNEEISNTQNIQSKIIFESDVTDDILNFDEKASTIKVEPDLNEIQDLNDSRTESEAQADVSAEDSINTEKPNETTVAKDILDCPHFKVKYTESGSKEYFCCINGKDNHYKTSLLISLKKHVQMKHSENWDGYCFICKVIVTPQGVHKFKDCLQHFVDKHIDSFPILEDVMQQEIPETNDPAPSNESEKVTNKSYINVRPLSDLISQPRESQPTEENNPILPVIENVISLGTQIDQPRPSPSYPTPVIENVEVFKQYKYEEFQAEIMSRKHRVVLEVMMSQVKLVQVFKCAGRFCSFTTDSAEDALLHASTHMRLGGTDALNCVYCDFDPSGNAIDLITHVFKNHGCCPFVCGTCFYRATASQLVNAHIKRVHENTANVAILKTPFQTPPIQEDNILSREAAVPFYLCCGKNDSEDTCKFRTYTPGKFCEHLQMRHASATDHLCFICSVSAPSPAELIRHLKNHGLKLYQCTWCVFGADNETELLEHASALHPARQPKAYLRIITNKEGTSEFRVLPLAQLNKSDVPAVEVTLNNQKDFPVREAERSIELEKLIGHTNFMIESMSTSAESNAGEKERNNQIETAPQPDGHVLDNINILETSDTQIPRMSTPVPSVTIVDTPENQLTPIIKSEVVELTPEKIPEPIPEVVCLDSDDESPNESVSSTVRALTPSLEVSVPAPITKVPLTQLFRCSKCKLVLKLGGGFKRHISACFGSKYERIPCAHCSTIIPKKDIINHYNTHHDKSQSPRYFCQKCSVGFITLGEAKDHQLMTHSITPSEALPDFIEVVVGKRRKRSLESKEKAIEPPTKVKRYGPEDIDKLPINPILDDFVVCSLCEFNTKVRLNMVRHLQLHAQQQPVPQTAPVNPVPHLETNEKHFDKMVNLASSSIATKVSDKSRAELITTVPLSLPPEAISRFPKYVPDKQRLTCGAKGCSYISVDETMLKRHWETLHYDSNDFLCPHCPTYQNLDKSRPLIAARIIAHLKMHDVNLYTCSKCSYYHYKLQFVEKHLMDIHKGVGQAMVVREGPGESSAATPANTSQSKIPTPTMDLKPWQCGLCKFKSLLRPEVVDHCAKTHNSKMQYKCAYCAFRTSNPENITKHQAKSHIGKPEEIFYFYYREGTVSDYPDGTTRWQKQSQNTVVVEPKVKSEDPDDSPSLPSTQTSIPLEKPSTPTLDLNLVKKETLEPIQDSVEQLCKEFGQFCDPNGLKYKCSLCTNVIQDSVEAMQSHLYEELQYRKWGCSICSYKAFHREGLGDHMIAEHRQNRDPIALPVDSRIETWVAKLLEHQTSLILKYKENLAKQKLEILRVSSGPSTLQAQPQQAREINSTKPATYTHKPNRVELEKTFGPFGESVNSLFCCPKCSCSFEEEDAMHSHLESELNKIRWFCSSCSKVFQRYHEAQFHSRSAHIGHGARPIEVIKDASVRSAWVAGVIRTQKSSMDIAPAQLMNSERHVSDIPDVSEPPEDSLLVVRYEETVPTPEEEMARKTPAPAVDSDDEKLVIDEPLENRKANTTKKITTILPKTTKALTPAITLRCPHCTFVTLTERQMRDHLLRHYGLKAFTCPYCGINGYRKTIEKHQKVAHPTKPINLVYTELPEGPPTENIWAKWSSTPTEASQIVCLVCRNSFTETESKTHVHDNVLTAFGKKGEVVVQCSVCFTLHKDVCSYQKHHNVVHPELSTNYVFSKLNTGAVEAKEMLYVCGLCTQKFSHLADMKSHAAANHKSALKYTLVDKNNIIPIIDLDEYDEAVKDGKRKNDDDTILPPSKKTARKSTTKLPSSKRFARKSTTKLPFNVPSEPEEFSFYGTHSYTEAFENVVTMMPFYNKMVPFTLERLREIININPIVRVKDIGET